jgi:hypothetical protein
MPLYRALTTYSAKVSVGLTFEAEDQASAGPVVRTITEGIVPFEILGTRMQHTLGAIEMWDSSITGFAIDDIFEDEDDVIGEDDETI